MGDSLSSHASNSRTWDNDELALTGRRNMKSTFVFPLLFLGLAGHTSVVSAQSPGTFTATGNLTRERMFHAATLLTNGKVLIAGGYAGISGWPVWASAELYDPASGVFTATGDMTAPRFGNTSTLLPDGKVLISGGHQYTANTPDSIDGKCTARNDYCALA